METAYMALELEKSDVLETRTDVESYLEKASDSLDGWHLESGFEIYSPDHANYHGQFDDYLDTSWSNIMEDPRFSPSFDLIKNYDALDYFAVTETDPQLVKFEVSKDDQYWDALEIVRNYEGTFTPTRLSPLSSRDASKSEYIEACRVQGDLESTFEFIARTAYEEDLTDINSVCVSVSSIKRIDHDGIVAVAYSDDGIYQFSAIDPSEINVTGPTKIDNPEEKLSDGLVSIYVEFGEETIWEYFSMVR